MSKKRRRHRLIIYYRLGQRWRTLPLLTAVLGILLAGLGWAASSGLLQGGNLEMLLSLWERRIWIAVLIVVSIALYLVSMVISHRSYVEVREKTLRVRAGFFRLDVSYKRVRQIRLVQVGAQYPPATLRGRDRVLMEPLERRSATAVDMKSWPINPKLLRRLWSKFMFAREGDALMLVVEDSLDLNREIQQRLDEFLIKASSPRGYQDPLERAMKQTRR